MRPKVIKKEHHLTLISPMYPLIRIALWKESKLIQTVPLTIRWCICSNFFPNLNPSLQWNLTSNNQNRFPHSWLNLDFWVSKTQGVFYSKKFPNLDPTFEVLSNEISPPTTKIDSHIRDSTWIFELIRRNFDRPGHPSWPHFVSQVEMLERYIIASRFVWYCNPSFTCAPFARSTS